MSCNIRSRTEGATYFFTIRLADRSSTLLVTQINDLRRAMRQTLQRYPFRIETITVLPSVIHTIWTLPPGDSNFPNRISLLKSTFSRALPYAANRTPTQIKRREKGIWQRRYWEHQIRDADDFARHRDMIYLSPVHAGLCTRPQDWLHGSYHRDFKVGDLKAGLERPAPIGYGAGALQLTHSNSEHQRHNEVAASLQSVHVANLYDHPA